MTTARFDEEKPGRSTWLPPFGAGYFSAFPRVPDLDTGGANSTDRDVIVPPGLEHGAGVRQRPEQRLVQQLVAQAAVEALDEAVLLWFTGRNVVPPDASLVCPVQDGVRGQVRAVVTDDRVRAAPWPANNVVQFPRHGCSRRPPPGCGHADRR